MDRKPNRNELPYRFVAPRPSWFWLGLGRWKILHLLRSVHRVEEIAVENPQHVQKLLDRGDGVLITPNHCDRADGLVMFEAARWVDRPFCYMAAHQIFEGDFGLRYYLFPRVGIFPVDREGTGLAALRASSDVLIQARHPLVVFPEGEVYYLSDKLTPLRDGVAAMALTALKKFDSEARTVWIVPTAIKYRFQDGFDPLPSFRDTMGRLEQRFHWWPSNVLSMQERIYRYARGILAVKEIEYLGEPRTGTVPERLANLRLGVLKRAEESRFGKIKPDEPVPVRVKELRRACLEQLAKPDNTPAQIDELQSELHDLFFVIQTYSYPGDYVRQAPTAERIFETLVKYEQDIVGTQEVIPPGPRRAVVRFGEPINVRDLVGPQPKSRVAVPRLTRELEQRIQAELDALGIGPLVPPESSEPPV